MHNHEFPFDEKEVIDFIMNYFKNFSTKQIVDYMHKEKAYLETKDNEFISYKKTTINNILKASAKPILLLLSI